MSHSTSRNKGKGKGKVTQPTQSITSPKNYLIVSDPLSPATAQSNTTNEKGPLDSPSTEEETQLNEIIVSTSEEFIKREYKLSTDFTLSSTTPFITLELNDRFPSTHLVDNSECHRFMNVRKNQEMGGTSGWNRIHRKEVRPGDSIMVEFWRQRGTENPWDHRWYVSQKRAGGVGASKK